MEVQKTVSFTEVLLRYQEAIAALSTTKSPELAQVLTVLISRDDVEAARENLSERKGEQLAELVKLDKRLQKLAGAIATHPQIEYSRKTLQPPKTAWWWFLEAPQEPSKTEPSRLAKFFHYDWVWNAITVACLVGAGTFATDTFKAFSSEELDLLQTFSAISQGAGLVLITGGTLTQKGQQVIRNTLSGMKIKPEYQAEVTCGLAALLLAVTYGVNASIPNLGEYFYYQGRKAYDLGYADRAKYYFERAKILAPNNAKISFGLGDVYETFIEYEKAESLYFEAVLAGVPAGLNGIGRTTLRTAKTFDQLVHAEGAFRWALTQSIFHPDLVAGTYGFLGFTLIRQVEWGDLSEEEMTAKYTEAEAVFKEAIAIEQTIDDTLPGMGMSYCYLGILYDKQEKTTAAKKAWQDCQNQAFPGSYAQYEDIVIYAPELAQNVDTGKIMRFENRDPKISTTK